MANADVNVSRQLGSIANGLTSLQQETRAVQLEVQGVGRKQEQMDDLLRSLQRDFAEYRAQDVLDKNLQLAKTEIGTVRDDLEREFGHYAVVRRSVTGLLQARDERLVTHDVVQHATEEFMFETPRYWLAPALVTLASWFRGDDEMAERAQGVCLDRDPDKASLFFALALRRASRSGADTWLTWFLQRQNPRELERQFVVLLDAVSIGAFGPAARESVNGVVSSWMDIVRAEPDAEIRERDRWHLQLSEFTNNAVQGYSVLPTVAVNWNQFEHNLSASLCHDRIGAYFATLFEGEVPKPPDLEAKVDEVLNSLVSNFDDEELPLRRREQELQAVIDHHGDQQKADDQLARERQALEELVDFPTLLTNAAMHPERASVSRGTQRLAVALTKDWIVAAHDKLSTEIHDQAPASAGLAIDGWHGSVGRYEDHNGHRASLAAFHHKRTEEAVAGIKFGGMEIAATIGAILFAVLAIATVSPAPLVLAIGLGLFAFFRYRGLDKRRDSVRAAGAQAQANAEKLLSDALAELVMYWRAWDEASARAEPVREELKSMIPSAHGMGGGTVEKT